MAGQGYVADLDSPAKEGGSVATKRVPRALGYPAFAPTAKDELAGVMAKLVRDIAEASAVP